MCYYRHPLLLFGMLEFCIGLSVFRFLLELRKECLLFELTLGDALIFGHIRKRQ